MYYTRMIMICVVCTLYSNTKYTMAYSILYKGDRGCVVWTNIYCVYVVMYVYLSYIYIYILKTRSAKQLE